MIDKVGRARAKLFFFEVLKTPVIKSDRVFLCVKSYFFSGNILYLNQNYAYPRKNQ